VSPLEASIVTLAALAVTAVFALWITPPRENQGFDAVRLLYLHVPTAWVAYLVLRLNGWSGRRAAYVALAGFALVVLVRLALPVTHFA